MQVNVFLARDCRDGETRLLILPAAQRSSSTTFHGRGWRFYGTLDSQSDLFEGIAVELRLQARGYVLVEANRKRCSCATARLGE